MNQFRKKFTPQQGRVIVGIEEAGRGPVLGYLVYGMFICTQSQLETISEFRDSKQLSQQQRKKLSQKIKSDFDYAYIAIHPQIITEKMTSTPPTNLNEISFQAVYTLLDELFSNYEVKMVYVDTLGDPKKYQDKLKAKYSDYFTVEVKADTKYKVVGGASILAKVTRDNLIGLFDCGSGYPDDPKTKKWLKDNLHPVFGAVENIVRYSWKTVNAFLIPRSSGVKGKSKFYEGFYVSDS